MEIEKEARQYHVSVSYLSMGSKFSGTDWSMGMSAPRAGYRAGEKCRFLVFRLKVRGLSVLLTGDLENEGEEMLVQSGIQHARHIEGGTSRI